MINKLKTLLVDKLSGNNPSAILYADKPTGQPPMSLFDIEEQTEHYLALANGEALYKGAWTGIFAGVPGVMFLFISIYFLFEGRYEHALEELLIAIALFVVPFVYEVLRPMPPPILFNRRTREVYFQHDGELFHTPWDGIAAVAYQFQMIGPYSGGTRNASLEVLIQCFGQPGNQLLLSLGLPMGKTIDLQESFWEYLRSYMNNGPWFDEQGHPSESDAFVKSQLATGNDDESLFMNSWRRIVKEYKASGGKNFLDSLDLILLFGGVFLGPTHAIQGFTCRIAKRRSRKHWPKLVTERLDPNGPTTRLIDIEHASDVKQEPDQGGMGQ